MDKILLAILQKKLESIAEEMATSLRLTALSPNIKERADFSTAIFSAEGELLAQADAIPVHLGSMSASVIEGLKSFRGTFSPGDVIIHNSPFRGGTHLPDITAITPVFVDDTNHPQFFVANRAHHADVGGMVPGSLPGTSTEVFQEGMIIPPIKLFSKGKLSEDLLALLLENYRTPQERRGDFMAQVGANRKGVKRMQELAREYGTNTILKAQEILLKMTENATRTFLVSLPDGEYEFTDYLDSDGISSDPIPIKATVHIKGDSAIVDFDGSAPQVKGNANAPLAVTKSAVYYVFRCLTGEHVPANSGGFRPIEIRASEGSVVNPVWPAAVSSGNTETSQRIVDVVFGALAKATDIVPAASQGTMNNVLVGGKDPKTHQLFSYYETIGGGTGATKSRNGEDAIHSHMTNTWNTPIEALETAYPIKVTAYRIRKNSGGKGVNKGGDGIIREYEFLTSVTISLQTERRIFAPWGLFGGENGKQGRNILIRKSGSIEELPGRITITAEPGDRLRIETPGGGGYGRREMKKEKNI